MTDEVSASARAAVANVMQLGLLPFSGCYATRH